MISVFTPTYNRKHTIPKLYNSLINQTCLDFQWIIVDDGSNDGTEELISEYILNKIINIKYFKQENAGKAYAINKGLDFADYQYFFIVDSDDYLHQNAISIIIQECLDIEMNNIIAGLYFHRLDFSNKIIGNKVPFNKYDIHLLDLFYKYNVKGDSALVYKTNILKMYLFPKFKNEKFVPEALIWNRIDKNYLLRVFNYGIYFTEYLDDGYTKNFNRIIKTNPKAFIIYYYECILSKIPIFYKIKYLIRTFQCILYLILKSLKIK